MLDHASSEVLSSSEVLVVSCWPVGVFQGLFVASI